MYRTFRIVGALVVIVGALFKIQHWPGANVLLIAGLLLAVIAVLLRFGHSVPVSRAELARDVAIFLLVGYTVMRVMHLPYRDIVFTCAIGATILWLWSARGSFLPSAVGAKDMPWLFYPALVLVIIGTVFRIQHWPGSNSMLIGGLGLGAVWFIATMAADRKS